MLGPVRADILNPVGQYTVSVVVCVHAFHADAAVPNKNRQKHHNDIIMTQKNNSNNDNNSSSNIDIIQQTALD